jgi:hypothetical protein
MRRITRLLFAATFALAAGTVVIAQAPPAPGAAPAPAAPAAAAPAAPAAAAPATPAITNELYPLKVASKWTYKLGETQVVEIVVESIKDGEATLSTRVNGKAVAKESVKVMADGVYRTKINDAPVNPPVKFLALPVKKDTKWSIDSKVQEQPIKGNYIIKEEKEKIKTKDNKEYDCVVVDAPELDVAGTKTSVKQWFSPTKGLVKLSYIIANYEATIELVEYVEGK